MQYHALSLAADKGTRRVTLIGYVGEKCVPPVEAHAKIHQQLMEPVELQSLRRRVPFLIYAVVKVLLLFWRFGVTLMWRTPGPLDAVLVQNPPALPTLAVAWLVCRLRGAKLVVDWHNLGYSVLAFELGKPTDTAHPAVAWPRAAETWLAARADAHFCVTHAMAAFLRTKLTPRGTTSARLALSALHDRPPRFFAHTALEAQHALFVRLEKEFVWPHSFCDASGSTSADVTPFTTVERQADGAQAVALRGERPALLVSSTSWSSDEDFSVLLDALIEYDRKAVLAMRRTQTSERLPPVVCVVTGKGPQKAMYLEVGKGGPPMRHLAVLNNLAASLCPLSQTCTPAAHPCSLPPTCCRAHCVARASGLSHTAWHGRPWNLSSRLDFGSRPPNEGP
jgi:beta-1,4-mannosyltransferase